MKAPHFCALLDTAVICLATDPLAHVEMEKKRFSVWLDVHDNKLGTNRSQYAPALFLALSGCLHLSRDGEIRDGGGTTF